MACAAGSVAVAAGLGRGHLYLEWVFGFGWPSGCLVSRLAVNDLVLCCFGSCDWATGVHARAARLGPPIIEAWRFLALVIIGELGSSLSWGLWAGIFRRCSAWCRTHGFMLWSLSLRFRFPSARRGRSRCPWPCGRLLFGRGLTALGMNPKVLKLRGS